MSELYVKLRVNTEAVDALIASMVPHLAQAVEDGLFAEPEATDLLTQEILSTVKVELD